MTIRRLLTRTTAIAFAAGALGLSACATAETTSTAQTAPQMSQAAMSADERAQFEADRQAILAMAGEYAVTFNFTETVAIQEGYELAEQKVTPAREVVYVIEDEGDFISLQHLLLVGDEESPMVIKHWRQDWAYEPERVMAYRGFQRWEMLDVSADERDGAWSQTVYQVDDSPRYAAVAAWEHEPNASTWEPPVSWRPLPRRDATTRDDYDVIAAVNRHTITPWGWTHEQDNSKVILRGEEPEELVREYGLNSYTRTDLTGDEKAAEYWEATQSFWAEVRDEWNQIIASNDTFFVDDDAEGTKLYAPVLSEGQAVYFNAKTTEDALVEAEELIDAQVETGVSVR